MEYIAYGRPGEKEHKLAQRDSRANVYIRMISGDHIETAKRVAIETGILDQDDADNNDAIMTGEQFR